MRAKLFKRIVLTGLVLAMLTPSAAVAASAEKELSGKESQAGDTLISGSSVSWRLSERLREISEEVLGSAGRVIKEKTNAFGVLGDGKSESSLTAEDPQVTRVRIIAVGDNLIHQSIIDEGQKSDGTCDYSSVYAKIKQYISSADVKIINQETPLVKNKADYSGYPTFGTPYGIGEATVAAGFNVFTLATNHSFDKGRKGVRETLGFYDRYSGQVLTTGMYRSAEEYNSITIGEYKGIKIAFLNYTYGLNGEHSGKDGDYRVKLLNEQLMHKELTEAKEKADFVIVLPHWGIEYETEPSKTQKELAVKLAEWGADCIIGTHPHVLQSFELIKTQDGREVPCYYSLGNFVSNMFDYLPSIEGMADLIIDKDETGVHIEYYDLKPLVNHITTNGKNHVVYPLGIYTPTLAISRPLDSQLGETGKKALKRIRTDFTAITGFE